MIQTGINHGGLNWETKHKLRDTKKTQAERGVNTRVVEPNLEEPDDCFVFLWYFTAFPLVQIGLHHLQQNRACSPSNKCPEIHFLWTLSQSSQAYLRDRKRRQNGKWEILWKRERERRSERKTFNFISQANMKRHRRKAGRGWRFCVLYLIHFQVDREKHADKESGHLPHSQRLHSPSFLLSFASTCCLLLIVTAPNQSSQ